MAAAEVAANQRAAQAAALTRSNFAQANTIQSFSDARLLDELNKYAAGYVGYSVFGFSENQLIPQVDGQSQIMSTGRYPRVIRAKTTTIPAHYGVVFRLANTNDLVNVAISRKLITSAEAARIYANHNAVMDAQNSGGFFSGLVSSVAGAWRSVAAPIQHQLESNLKVAVQVATLGDKKAADSIIKSTQDAARNPVVQMVAATALTVYTGGLAGAALAEGMGVAAGSLAAVGTSAAGTFIASAAVGKAQDKPFNLQKALQSAALSVVPAVGNFGVKAGMNYIGGSAAGALVEMGGAAQFAVNAGLSAAASGIVSKVSGKGFNLQDSLLTGVAAAAKASDYTAPAMQAYTGVKALVDLKDAVDKAKASKDATAAQKAKVDSQLAAINAENARMEAVKAEIKAMEAKLAAHKPADPVPIKTPVVTPSQPVALAAAPVVSPAQDNKIAALTLGLGLLKLLA